MTLQSTHSISSPRTGFSRLILMLMTTLLVWSPGCQSMDLATHSLEMMPERQELALGAKTYQTILDTHPRSPNAHLTQMLERVGQRLAAVSERPDYEWEFTLLSGPLQNAFCLPGGKVGVYEGILPACQNEAGLAVVLSHEIAHALARHGGERMSHKMASEEANWSFSRMIGLTDSQRIDMVKSVHGLESAKGVPLPYSRTQEAEADSIGLLLMARAGYDPNEAPRFWERLNRSSGEKTPELLATHPSDDTRAAKLKEIVPRALSVYQGASQRYRLGEQIPMEALAELIPKPAPKATEPDKVAAATAAVTPSTTPPAATTPAAAPANSPAPAASPAPAVVATPAAPTATPPAATAAAPPAAEATPQAVVTANVTPAAVTPAPIVQVSASSAAAPATAGVAAQLPGVGTPTVEGSPAAAAAAAAQTTTAEKPAATPQESGGWKSHGK